MFAVGGSVATLCIGGGGALATDTLAACPWSNVMLIGRWLRGGEYGGGGNGDAFPVSVRQYVAEMVGTHSEVPGRTGQAGRAASDPERARRLARISILADCTAEWRSGGSDRMRRRRGNSQTRPTLVYCWSAGRDSRPATPSIADSTPREAAPSGLAKNSS